MDVLAVMAREAHRQAIEHVEHAARFREQRDDAIRRLYEQGGITYVQIAEQIGITKELVAKIIQGRSERSHAILRDGRVKLAQALWRDACRNPSMTWDRLSPEVQQHWIDRAERVQS